ncbi:hypothetical protein EXN66_Car010977 [Channa argus]|uniref:Peptidase C80 domain-containing protein n=1 Tax=Channa argus TaxID=215402 RepID=A0A6G1PY87_CHAAH|nr:hypothetical protein EXN66_Car010977 [Channa argus]
MRRKNSERKKWDQTGFSRKFQQESADAEGKETPTSSALYFHSCNKFPVIRRTRIPTGLDIDQNPMSLQDDLQGCENFTTCVIQKEKDFDSFLAAIDEQKTHDWLISASEISHSYSQKLLIMTDSETTTNDRVQHEYSMDPRYSVIISDQCLYNESCLPDADVYTVVKIFGRVSADGQTVSGLSGSSIAELMMKPSLEAVPVFSFDGNTTTDFQHNFMRVFVVRGIKAVLETNLKNHQIYQVMDQPDSVSSYRIPQRPVDPSTQYDHQQILIMEDDPVVRKAATYLYEKHPSVSSIYVLDQNQKPKLIHGDPVPLSEYSRLVLVGHGRKDNSREMRLGGHKAQDVAEIVQNTYRSSNKIKTTSVVACEVGSDKVFVETLVRQLHDTAHIETELHLRNSLLQVRHTGEKITQEIFSDGLRWRHKDDSKKVVAMLDRNGDVIVRDEPGKSGDSNGLPASGTLGGYDDGHITSQDVKSASKWEDSFKHESYFSRVRASYDEQIHNELKSKYGGNLQLQGDSARIENGQFICQLVSDSEPAEFRIDLSPESQQYNEKMLKSIETAVNDMETYVSQSSHPVSKFAEHAGTAVGTLGLMLGMKGAVRAFEQGDIKDGVMGSLQTAHGVTAMTTSVIAKQALSSEARVARAAATIMRSPAMKGAMTAIPIVGIGFGFYNLVQDLERGDTLGYIDATLDSIMVGLDSFEIAQPELAPFIMPINLVLSTVRMGVDDVYMGIYDELNRLPKDASILDKVKAVFVGFGKGIQHFGIHVASFFYDWRYDEIEEGRRLVEQISDYHKYYRVTKEEDGTSAIDFSGSDSSWNGGGINFCLADQGQSEFCMDYFVSSDESFGKKCWYIDTQGSKDIILGLGESHQLEYKTLQKKVLMFIPAGSVKVVSGYKAVSYSRYGNYKGNRESNRFFAVQKSENKDMIEVMLSYYYRLYGEPGDDIFFLGRQQSYVEGSGGKDTYMIPENGGKTIINNYDPSKSMDTLHFSVDYSHISVSKSGDDVVLIYEGSHTVIMQNWFLGESYRHMSMMSGDGVLFEISSTVVSSVQLVTRGINKMFMTQGQTVNTSQPLLRTVTNILGSPYDDVLIGNTEKNLIDGGGGRDLLIGGEGEDLYIVNDRKQSSVWIENYSRDNETDLVMIEANLHTFTVWVQGDNVTLSNPDFSVTLVNWFRSPADRHLLVVTKDLITFTISDKKTDCLQSDPFNKCIKSYRIDYSKSQSPLIVDLQEDEALNSVTEVRGSNFDDVIRGNNEHNVFFSGSGDDFIQGRGGVDWYIITPGQGVKTINNQSPDGALDVLFLQQPYQQLTCTCEGQNIIVLVNGNKNVILEKWFVSENYRHLQIKTSDGITAGLKSNLRSCGGPLMLPLTVDYRNQEPEPLVSPILQDFLKFQLTRRDVCFRYTNKNSEHRNLCGLQGKVMMMDDTDSVKEMYGSSGFDIMVGNSNDNLLDPYTGGALMSGRNGKDTYIIKHGYGDNIMIDNFAEDQKIDTVLVDMDFLDGSQIQLQRMELDSSLERDQKLIITTKGEKLHLSLLNYNNGYQHQHLEFQSSDGVHFKLVPLNSTGEVPVFVIEAFKVTLKQSQVDCHLDLNSVRNLSKVHTVQGCPSQSNTILGNDEDNALIGGWKDDALEGGEGDDTLIGGNGDDLLIGGFGDDTLYGEDGNDTMMGNSGRDVFIPGPGADLVNGGPGKDAVLYRGDHEKGEGVYVNLLTGQGRYADAEGDVLKDVETVIGTIYSDILVSGYESALLTGSDGNDILVSTGGDYLVGGDGSDIYMLAFHHGSVTINNCAKDNATDVLYLHSQSTPMFDGQRLSDTVLLTFYGINQTTVKITLQDWVSDHNECGHLMLVFKDKVVSVDRLLQEFQFRQKERVSYDHLS